MSSFEKNSTINFEESPINLENNRLKLPRHKRRQSTVSILPDISSILN